MVVYNIRLGYDGSPNGIHGVGGVLDIPPPGCSPPCGAKGWLPGNRVRSVPGSTILATAVGSWRRSQRRQRSSAESCLNQDEERIYAKELSDEAEWPCATKEA